MSGLGSAGRLAKRGGVGSLATTNDGGVSDWMQPDQPDVRRKRILFRCWNRGTQQGDLIFGRFAECYLPSFDDVQIEQFEALLDCTDPDLFDWVVAGIAPTKEHNHDVMRLLQSFALMKQKN